MKGRMGVSCIKFTLPLGYSLCTQSCNFLCYSYGSRLPSRTIVYCMQYIPGGPKKTEQSIQTIFQDFALINSYFCSPCWIEHLFLIIITPRSSNLVENFLFYE